MAKYTKLKIVANEGLDNEVTLIQRTQNTFCVFYGDVEFPHSHVVERGDYARAMREFSECVAHSANCMGNNIKLN
ncbi:MAG: hypothetical protein COB09_18650 [Thalassobium sp.]|nr:MAG: hypothetical protein COB09_18650 [Thalassobium sp.]